MAKISYREKILLGYNPNSISNSSSRRNSEVEVEVDFSDVFGGPPRCSSSTTITEYYNNDIDSNHGNGDSDAANLKFGLREKPVFGDQTGVQRRHYRSDDFYDDIFGGDHLLLTCPSVHMSPSRPPTVAAEPSGSPSKFSLPGRVANTDTMTSTSKNQSLSKFLGRSLSRLNHIVQNRSTLNVDDAHTSNQPTSLPRHITVDEKGLKSDSKKNGTKDQHEPKFTMEESKGSKFAKDNMQFHFSIYKWANNGVPIAIPSRKRSPSKPKERMASDVNMIKKNSKKDESVNVAILSSKRRMPSSARTEHDRNNSVVVGEVKAGYKHADSKLEKKPTNEAGEALNQKGLEAKMKKHSQKMKKWNSKPLRTLLGQEKEGNKKARLEKGRKQSKVNETEKQSSLKNDIFPSYKVSRKSKVRESSSGKTDDFRKVDDVSGIVKGFVKIFNQGSSHKNSYVNTFPTKNHDEMQNSYVYFGNTSFDCIEVIDGESFLSEEQEYNINGSGDASNSATNDEEQEYNINGSGDASNSATNDGTSINGSRASTPQTSTPHVDNNRGKTVTQDIGSPLVIESEETQNYERKVRQWCKGKEENIRALLSTMQNILWPNSGWKPIPLVDIIEANAVKKAYQRALLCLHPDKLQQKGAPPHHKFIAEKVFDILQEAWDQFNSNGML